MKQKGKTKNEEVEKMPNITVTIDDASAHLLGMIDEMRANFSKEIERINRINDALVNVVDNLNVATKTGENAHEHRE